MGTEEKKGSQNFDGQSLGRGRERADQTFNLASRRATMPVERHRVARVAGESELRLLQQPIPFCQSSRGKRLWTFCPGRRRPRLWMEGGACRAAGRGAAGSTGGECCGASCSHCPVGPTTLARLAGRQVVPRVPLTCLAFRLPVFSRHGLNSFDWEFFFLPRAQSSNGPEAN
jgi:hypothetical protein